MKTFIFDMDGTLIDSLPDVAEASNRSLKMHGLPERTLEEVRRNIGHGLDDRLTKLALPAVLSPSEYAELKKDYCDYYAGHCTALSYAYSGMTETLTELKRRGHRLIVATNKRDRFAHAIADKLFAGIFDRVIGQLDGVPPKPDPALGKYITGLLSVSPADCVMVGDSKFDMLFARSCGFFPLGVRWGYSEKGELESSGAEFIAERPADILSLA